MAFPPEPPKQRTRPYPQGTPVTGFSQTGIFGFPGHNGHGLFETISPPTKAETSNSGYHQDVLCITCGTEFVGIDCEFLMVKATKEQIKGAINGVTKARNRLMRARQHYVSLLEKRKL
jgi:hypothetical protein